jgi:hypothetical protein
MRVARWTLSLVGLLLVTSSEAEAQWWKKKFKFQSGALPGSVTAFGYYVGPFVGTITSDPGRPVVDLFCVDVLNQIKWGHDWTANISNLGGGNLSLTRHGNAKAVNYKKAAWLSTQFKAPGVTVTQYGGIQLAMWNLLNPGAPFGGAAETTWLTAADDWYDDGGWRTFDFSTFYVVTDTGAVGRKVGGGTQEFLVTGPVVTPEPGTWILLGTGLLAIAGLAVVRGVRA